MIRSLRFATLLALCCIPDLDSGASARGIVGHWRGSLFQPEGTPSLTLELHLRETGDIVEGSLDADHALYLQPAVAGAWPRFPKGYPQDAVEWVRSVLRTAQSSVR